MTSGRTVPPLPGPADFADIPLEDDLHIDGLSESGVYRMGDLLVVERGGELPTNLCIKTGQPADRTRRKTYYWHHPALALTILVNILVYAVLALVLRKRCDLVVPYSSKWLSERRRFVAMLWLIALACVVLMFFGFTQVDRNDGLAVPCILGGVVGWLASAIAGVATQPLRPKRIDDYTSRFKGAHPAYLAQFPQYTRAI